MKKFNALALVVAAAFAAGTVQAENVTGPYLFGGLGMSHIDDDDDFQSAKIDEDGDYTSTSSGKNKFAFKVGAGYDFNEYFGLALGFYHLGKAEWSFTGSYSYEEDETSSEETIVPNSRTYLRTQGVALTANIGYPVTEWFKPYLKVGAGWFHGKLKAHSEDSDDSDDSEDGSESHSDSRVAPIAGVGFQFNLTSNFALTAEYEHIFNAVKFEDSDPETGESMSFKPDYDLVTIGFKYIFGGATAPVAPVTTTERVTETHTLDAGILFPFDGSTLSSEGKQAVSDIIAGSSDIDNAAYSVYGFTDRLGSDAYNQTLSEKRANAVADELTADGVTNIVNVQGFGKSNPVTGDQCDSVKGRKALIDCLQPDRRVEVQVVGDRTVTK